MRNRGRRRRSERKTLPFPVRALSPQICDRPRARRGEHHSLLAGLIVLIFGDTSLLSGREIERRRRSVADLAVLFSDGEHGAVDAAVAAALRGDAVAARDVQGQVRLVGAHDHRRRIHLLPPLPAAPHRAFPLIIHLVFTFVSRPS